MGTLRSVWTATLIAGGAALAYQGYQNSRIPHPVDVTAEAIACDELRVCTDDGARWRAVDVSPFARIYRMQAASGPLSIECRWAWVLFGEVTCRADREPLAPKVEETPVPRPHETRRGNP